MLCYLCYVILCCDMLYYIILKYSVERCPVSNVYFIYTTFRYVALLLSTNFHYTDIHLILPQNQL